MSQKSHILNHAIYIIIIIMYYIPNYDTIYTP